MDAFLSTEMLIIELLLIVSIVAIKEDANQPVSEHADDQPTPLG